MMNLNVNEYAMQVAAIMNGTYREVEKANGVICHGVMLDMGNMSPVVYVDRFFAEGLTPDEAAERIREDIVDAPKIENPMEIITDYEQAGKMLRARLYNKATKAEVYRSAAEYGFEDLIIIPYIDLGNGAAAKVTKSLLDHWGQDADTVISLAIENARDYTITPLAQVLAELMGGMPFLAGEDDVPLYVLTNENKTCGAIGVIAAKAELEERFPNGYVVLPSSIHEVLILPKEQLTQEMEALSEMIVEINQTQVAPEEVLGDHPYEFDGIAIAA